MPYAIVQPSLKRATFVHVSTSKTTSNRTHLVTLSQKRHHAHRPLHPSNRGQYQASDTRLVWRYHLHSPLIFCLRQLHRLSFEKKFFRNSSIFLHDLSNMSCKHATLHLTPSPFAELAGYEQPSEEKRAAAERRSGRASKQDVARSKEKSSIKTLPAPLVLPHDDLNYDPEWPPQSVRGWAQEKERNKLRPRDARRNLYIGRVPSIEDEVAFMRPWAVPKVDEPEGEIAIDADAELFADYLRAFYHDMNVHVLPTQLSWTAWKSRDSPADAPTCLNT